MDDNNIIQFKQQPSFYFKLGSQNFADGKFEDAIKNLRKAIELIDNNIFVKCSYCLLLAQVYAKIGLYELSNYYLHCSLECESFKQIAYLGLGENYFALGNDYLVNYYFNKSILLLENSEIAKKAKEKLEKLQTLQKSKFKVHYGKEQPPFNADEEVAKAEIYMSQGKFEEAILHYKNIDYIENARVRSGLSLAYYFTNNVDTAIDIAKSAPKATVDDICNLALYYFNDKNEEQFKIYKQKLLDLENYSKEESLKIAITFAQIGEHHLSRTYAGKNISEFSFDIDYVLYFCIACINTRDFDCAKTHLLRLKNINPFGNYIYNFYLDICSKKSPRILEYLTTIPYSAHQKLTNNIKTWMSLSENEFKTAVLNNIDACYYTEKYLTNKIRTLLYLRIADFNNQIINNFFEFLFLSPNIDSKQKINLLLKRFDVALPNKVNVILFSIHYNINLGSLKVIRKTNFALYEAIKYSLEFILENCDVSSINLKEHIVILQKILSHKDIVINKYVLSCILVWLFCRREKRIFIKKICNHFLVSESDFFATLEQLNIEI